MIYGREIKGSIFVLRSARPMYRQNDVFSPVSVSGIPGLDDMIGGGFIKGSIFVLIGETGTGRTMFSLQYLYQYGETGTGMFSLQYLYQGLLNGEKVMYISLFNPVEQLTGNFF